MKKHILITVVLSLFVIAQSFAQTYNILDFGAKTDTTVLNTKAIQAAIDMCHSKGGGEVIVPAGTYYTPMHVLPFISTM